VQLFEEPPEMGGVARQLGDRCQLGDRLGIALPRQALEVDPARGL
jgi:hypothetical protein